MPLANFLRNRLNTASKSKLLLAKQSDSCNLTSKKSDIPVVVICAPTACGKTFLAQHLFSIGEPSPLAGKAEIISADSMQVYCGMDIGTAKPDIFFLEKLPHHLINLCNPNVQFGAGDFVRHATIAATDIFSRGKLPVILGGTAFYIKNFVYGLPTTPRADESIRHLVSERMKNCGSKKLWEELQSLDPESAVKIHANDEYRIKRALEVCIVSGCPRSSFMVPQKKTEGYNFLLISLERTRQELYERIDKRVDTMFEQGLVKEVQSLIAKGYVAGDPGMQAIGYREFFSSDEFDEVKALIKKNSRSYAKRQQTFFKSLKGTESVFADDFAIIQKKILDFYADTNLSPLTYSLK